MITIKATIFFEKQFWVGVFERIDKKGYQAARHIFGGEPSDMEVHDFVLTHYQDLKFGEAKEISIEIHRMNPKRAQREVRREMAKIGETMRPSTFAQDYMREELEKQKKTKKILSCAEKVARKEEQFVLKQDRKKEKKRGC